MDPTEPRKYAVRRNGYTGAPVVFDARRGEKFDVAHVYGQGHPDEEGQWVCASLFAAAPETAAERDRLREINAELLEALEFIVSQAEDEANASHTLEAWKHGAGMSNARRLIAKATDAPV